MKVPLSWLSEYVDVTLPVAELARRLTLAGLELGGVRAFGLPVPDGLKVDDVSRAQLAIKQPPSADAGWGILTKRLKVDLLGGLRPELVEKDSERLAEILNIAATIERLL